MWDLLRALLSLSVFCVWGILGTSTCCGLVISSSFPSWSARDKAPYVIRFTFFSLAVAWELSKKAPRDRRTKCCSPAPSRSPALQSDSVVSGGRVPFASQPHWVRHAQRFRCGRPSLVSFLKCCAVALGGVRKARKSTTSSLRRSFRLPRCHGVIADGIGMRSLQKLPVACLWTENGGMLQTRAPRT